MKKISLFIVILLIMACSTTNDATKDSDKIELKNTAVCLKEGAVLTSIEEQTPEMNLILGETVEILEDNSQSKTNESILVKRIDGSQGYISKQYVVLNGRPAVIKDDSVLYTLPDLNSTLGEKINKLLMVAVPSQNIKSDFRKISWFDVSSDRILNNVYVKADDITQGSSDIACARILNIALKEKDTGKRKVLLESAFENFKDSLFHGDIENELRK